MNDKKITSNNAVATSGDPTLCDPDKTVATPQRSYPRARFHDYNGGVYFVTVCTKDMIHFFGNIQNAKMHLTPIGEELQRQLLDIKNHYTDVEIPLHVVMPNHFHAIIIIKSSSDEYLMTTDNLGRLNQKARFSLILSEDPTLTTHHSCRLGNIVSSIKAGVTRFARKNNITFAWQPRYHDHIIRGLNDGNRIAKYIENNVANWKLDCFYS